MMILGVSVLAGFLLNGGWKHVEHPALEHLPIHLRVGLDGMLREHEGDEGKALGLLGQAVNG